jgi:type IV pilus assembly protein PilM
MSTKSKIERPRVACEITASRLIAARATAAQDGLDLYASRRAPANAVLPSVLGTQIEDMPALASELQAALEAVSGKHRDVAVVVPDSAVRVSIFDFDHLPAGDEETRAVVRLRFRRNVPFEVEDAAVSFQRLPARGSEVRVLAVAMPKPVLEGYEGAVREAGYQPGVVIPTTLAALGAIDTSRPCMVVRHVPATSDTGVNSTMIVIASKDDILLYRSIEGNGPVVPAHVLDEVYPSLVFYEDNYGSRISDIYLDGVTMSDIMARSFEDQTGTAILPLPQTTMGQNVSGTPLPEGALTPLTGVLTG